MYVEAINVLNKTLYLVGDYYNYLSKTLNKQGQ